MRSRIFAMAAVCLWLAASGALAEETAAPAEPTSVAEPSADAVPADEADAADEEAPPAVEGELELPDAEAGVPEMELEPAPEAGAAAAEPPAEAAPAIELEPAPPAAPSSTASHQVTLGDVGHDESGQPGRIHVVVKGDTLWDISDAYLGTPWVWPSIWKDNRGIANPHLIHPGDRIWITPTEMRPVSEAEAERLLSGTPADAGAPDAELALEPAAESDATSEDSSPVPIPVPPTAARETGRTLSVPDAETAGLVATEVIESAASVVESPVERVFLGSGDPLYIGLGEGEVAVGDEFRIVRKMERVVDVETGADLGYHVATLGWVRVTAVHPETSTAEVRLAVDSIERGDLVLPRKPRAPEVVLKSAPPGIEGQIVFVAQQRIYTGNADRVFLNRGALHGLEVGTELDVFDGGSLHPDRVRRSEVMTPDESVGRLVVIDVDPETATALVVVSERELTIGDHFRGHSPAVASR